MGGGRDPPGHWRWWPTILPGATPTGLPTPFRDALQWAFDLHEGMPGPHGLGQIPWSYATGRVGEPAAWTLRTEAAADSATGHPTVLLIVWAPVLGSPGTYFGLVTQWDRQNRTSGAGAISVIQPVSGEPLAQLVVNGRDG
ncbi:protein of unknown function [Candidatus Hydrogenisulfobacillus filiaventi]|uniref:Uncharacterized protein n=1 Tax=Candidatus Hydrogenisulfobacillus filiaventi TaxID=2707344 RepID=A0A6F8ZGK6_9FIRM|nr:protein of unknown function [Candidatus Hydrogenisulfobacillus filiaventi]